MSSVVIGEGKIGLPDGFVMSERMRKVAAKRGLDRGSTKALFVKFCAYYRGNGAEHDDWEKTWAGWVVRQYVKVGSPGRERWEKHFSLAPFYQRTQTVYDEAINALSR